jgi:hypothetical protein
MACELQRAGEGEIYYSAKVAEPGGGLAYVSSPDAGVNTDDDVKGREID